MRGFLLTATAVLLVIGTGVGVEAVANRVPTVLQCSSPESCVQVLRDGGITTPIVVPNDPDLRFEEGLV